MKEEEEVLDISGMKQVDPEITRQLDEEAREEWYRDYKEPHWLGLLFLSVAVILIAITLGLLFL